MKRYAEKIMNRSSITRFIIILAFALVGWAICGAIMGIGRAVTTLDNTLVIHAIATPIVFSLLSWVYFTRYGYTLPLQTALIFIGVVIGLDVFLVAPVLERSFEMFTSLIGTWVPFTLIFLSTYLTGLVCANQRRTQVVRQH
jgi:hypothetical protein